MTRCVTLVACLGYLLLSLGVSAQTHQSELTSWRALYRQASETDQAKLMALAMDSARQRHPDSPMAKGFLAVAELMLAEESWNPMDKLARFNAWQPVLDAAISAMPGDPDLALLRLGVQAHVPALLNYDQDMVHDEAVVRQALARDHWSNDPEHAAFAEAFLTYLKSL
jgi:hypothetical protein